MPVMWGVVLGMKQRRADQRLLNRPGHSGRRLPQQRQRGVSLFLPRVAGPLAPMLLRGGAPRLVQRLGGARSLRVGKEAPSVRQTSVREQ